MRRVLRHAVRPALGMMACGGSAALFVALIVATDGATGGAAAWLLTFCTTAAAAIRFGGLIPVTVAAALCATVCVPTVPVDRRHPADLPFVATQRWELATGSRVAVYHYPPPPGVRRQPVPLIYVHGGPIRGISLLDHGFLRRLAGQGHDVYAYEQAGGGRSDLLPMAQYGVDRLVADLGAVIDRLGTGRADVLGFSSGAVVLTRALADTGVSTRLHRAIIAEPGPMDGPTARLPGHPGEPTARGSAPAAPGSRSTHLPRYAVGFGLMRLGLLGLDNGLIGQAESVNAFTAADLGSDTASAYCAADAHRIPAEDSPANFSFNAAASLRVRQTIEDSPSLVPRLRRSRTPTMLMIAECSGQLRQWATAVLTASPGIERTQVMPGVGHRMSNTLDHNDERAAAVITAFLESRPPPLPNQPDRAGIPAFLGP